MQTTHKIPGDSASRYAHYLTSTASRGDYYTADGDPDQPMPSRWHGPHELLESLGLDPEEPVQRSDLREVMQGLSPQTGLPFRPAGSDRTRVAGVELMLAPPKSVSALWAASDPYRRAQLEAAHKRAVASALQRTEREVALVRRKANGVVHFERARSLFGAEFVHTSSRLARDAEAGDIPDPQLHSHVILFAAERTDGKLAAIESRRLYRSARENGAHYRAELAANLRELGLSIERRTGNKDRYFEVRRVPEDLASRWSSRSEDVDRAARLFRQRYGREPHAGELGSLTTSTRGSKTAAERHDIDAAWRALAAEHGLGADRASALFESRPAAQPRADFRRELLTEVTRERAAIEVRDLRAKAYEISAGICRPQEADKLIVQLEHSGELIRLEGGTFTTRRLREMEKSTLKTATRHSRRAGPVVREASLRQARREIAKEIHSSLSPEQRKALQTITGTAGVSVLVGRAGTGKGVVLSTAARTWQLEGREVIGTAVAGATAQRLKDDAGLDRSFTADSLINGAEGDRIHLRARDVIVMDEAAMADTDRLHRLVEVSAEAGAKLVLVGDSAQLGPIGPGGLFDQLQDHVPSAELRQVHRANHEWEQRAWDQVRSGEPGPALATYRAHDRLHIYDTRAEAAAAMVDEWDKAKRAIPEGRAAMVTDASNKERDQINAMAQERRAAAGELGSDRVELPGKPYGLHAGDEIILSAPLEVPGANRVENGITGTVLDVDAQNDKIAIRTDEREPRNVSVDTKRFPELNLSYALHVYKAQGITTDSAEVLIGGWQTHRESAYVALSRARERTEIYVAREDLGEAGLDLGAVERLAQRMRESRGQEATIANEADDRSSEHRSPVERALARKHEIEHGFDI